MSNINGPCIRHGVNCYAVALNRVGRGEVVYRVEEFCAKCGAHLGASGVCLNACDLGEQARAILSRTIGGPR